MGYFDEAIALLTGDFSASIDDRAGSQTIELALAAFEANNPAIDTATIRRALAQHRAAINSTGRYSFIIAGALGLVDTGNGDPVRLLRADLGAAFAPVTVAADGTAQNVVMVNSGLGAQFFQPAIVQNGTAQLTYGGTTALDGASFNLGQAISVQLGIDPGARTVQGVVWKINGTICRDDDIDAPFTLRYNNSTITFGADFNGEGPGHTGTVFSLGTGDHTFLAEVTFTDLSTLTCTATVTVQQVTIPPSTGRGLQPNGSVKPPGVPAYSTPATVVVPGSASAISAAITAAQGGDVIEVSTNGLNGQAVTISGTPANASAANRVLVRPPIGQRWAASEIVLAARNVCLAGYSTSGKIGVNGSAGTEGDGSGFWRCGKSTAGFRVYGVTDGFFYECFSRDPRIDTETDVSQVNGPSTRIFYAYCWFNESIRPAGSTKHVDTVQLVGSAGNHIDPSFLNCVFFGASNAAIQIRDAQGLLTIRNCELGRVSPGTAANLQCASAGAALVLRDNLLDGSAVADIDPGTWTSFDVAGNVSTSSFNGNQGGLVNPSGNQWNTGVSYKPQFTPFAPNWAECPF